MIDPREIPAFWGLCGGLLSGAVGLVTAYSAKAGNPVAQRRAWLHLGLGIVAGPIVAEALTQGVILAVVPILRLDEVDVFNRSLMPNDALHWSDGGNELAFRRVVDFLGGL